MRLLTAVSGVRVPQQAPLKETALRFLLFFYRSPRTPCRCYTPPKILSAGAPDITPPKILSAGTPMLLFASQKCKTFAVLLVPAELSHLSLIFAPRGGFAAVSFFYRFFLEPPDAVFALHDSRVQISWRKHAIPSRLALLTGVESAGRRHRRRKAIVAEPRALARGFCILSCGSSSRRKNARRSLCSSFLRNYRAALSFLLRAAASPRFLSFYRFFLEPPDAVIPHRKCFRRGPRFMPHRKFFRWGPRFDAVGFVSGGKRVF